MSLGKEEGTLKGGPLVYRAGQASAMFYSPPVFSLTVTYNKRVTEHNIHTEE